MPEDAEDNDTPMLIGARNPFVYAEHKSDDKIKWHEMSLDEKRKKLKDVFKMPYEELFNPLNEESPLFVQAGDLRPCTTVSNPIWAPNPEGSNYTVTSRLYKDPVQGDLPDCYFIAALSSLAFLSLIPGKLPPYTYTFYYPPAVVGGTPTADRPVVVTDKLPLDATLKYHYSKSCTAGEIWIAMYEKAFARWINRRNGTDSDTPDYSKICQGDPVLALMNLTGWKYTPFDSLTDPDVTTSTATKYSTKNFTDGTQIFIKIRDSACKTVGAYKVAKFPMVAFTYDPRIEPLPAGVTYTDATIVGNHSYSVLGVHTIGANNYIVMRNPWGQLDPDPANLPAGALASGQWYQTANLADNSDAIFALKASVFRDYFKGFGWVYQ